jgi:nicotinate-nucleotide adenylyltransferase
LKTIGLLGGSFNPAHDGHRHISVEALRLLGLDEIWWLVSPQNPLKPESGMAALPARMASAQRAKRHPRIKVRTTESDMRTRFTIDTVAALQRRFPAMRFIWLMGADNLAQFHRWKAWRRLARLVPIAVFPRPGYEGASLTSPAMAWYRRWRRQTVTAKLWQDWELPAIVKLNIRLSQQSASRLRARNSAWADTPKSQAHR